MLEDQKVRRKSEGTKDKVKIAKEKAHAWRIFWRSQWTKGNLHNLFTILMALCETKAKNQVRALLEYRDMDRSWTQWHCSRQLKK